MIPPLRIALSGGGMKGIAHVGALEVLQEHGLLRCVKEYIGTSAGALIAMCMAAGYTLSELRMLCTVMDFTLLQDLSPDTILGFPEEFGLDSGAGTERLLGVLLRSKGFSPTATFEELAAGSACLKLRVYAVDIHACATKEFSLGKTPRMSVAAAVRASMSIPFFFTPVVDPDTGHLLVDGGVIAHFPFHHLTRPERDETIGIAFNDVNRSLPEPIPITEAKAKGLPHFIIQLYFSVYYSQNKALYEEWGHRIIIILCGQFPAVHFDATVEQKSALMAFGRNGAEDFLRLGLKGVAPPRRYSVS